MPSSLESWVAHAHVHACTCTGFHAHARAQACQAVCSHHVFDTFIIVLIVISSICLALDVPRLDPTSDLHAVLATLNLWMAGFFVGEMLLKIVTFGFVFTPKAYLKDPWNILDFVIVIISILSLLSEVVPAFGRLKALRILRVRVGPKSRT